MPEPAVGTSAVLGVQEELAHPGLQGLEPDTGGSQASPWRLIGRTFLENRLAIVGVAIVVGVTAFCFLGPLIYHTNQVATDISQNNLPPGKGHPLGTDSVGYDILGRLMVGGQSSIEVGFAVALLATVLGVSWGAVAGYTGGVVDAVMMRVVDAALAIPGIFLFLYLFSIFKPSTLFIILVLSAFAWLVPARLARGETLTIRSREYVEAVRSMGGSSRRIIVRHIVPNAAGTIVVNATFQVADAILALALLSYLGFGLPPPAASWGDMLSQAITSLYDGYWWQVYPVLVLIVLVVVAFNFIGDALRDSLEVRLRQR